ARRQHAVARPRRELPPALPTNEPRRHHAGPAGQGQDQAAKADQRPRRREVREPGSTARVGAHRLELRAARAEGLGDGAAGVEAAVDDALLDRLVTFAIDLARDNGRARDLELVALAAHGLDQDRQVQLAAAADL